MPKLESLIVLEEALARKVGQVWGTYAKKMVKKILAAIEDNDEAEAYRLVKLISSDDVADEVEGYAEYIFTNALVLGASRWAVSPSDTIYANGDLPPVLDTAVEGFLNGIKAAAETVRKRAAKVVQAHFEKAKELVVAKAVGALCTNPDHHHKGDVVRVFKVSDLAKAMTQAVDGTGKAMFNAQANLTTSRLISYGGFSQAEAAGHTLYQITAVLDTLTCPVCRTMHGRTFETKNAQAHMEQVLSLTDPAALTQAAPWPKQDAASVTALGKMTRDDMQNAGFEAPPYHPHCRCTVVSIGSVQPLPPAAIPTPKAKPVPKTPPALGPERVPSLLEIPNNHVYASTGHLEAVGKGKALQVNGNGLIDDDTIKGLLVEAKVVNHETEAMATWAYKKSKHGTLMLAPIDKKTGTNLKSWKAIRDKIVNKLDPNVHKGAPGAAGLTDLSRASVAFEDVDDLYDTLGKFVEKYDVVRYQDRFINPVPGGYRDVIMNVRTSTGHIVEVQFHAREIIEFKNKGGHALYKIMREIKSKAVLAGRTDPTQWLPSEVKAFSEAVKQSEDEYTARFLRFLNGTTK